MPTEKSPHILNTSSNLLGFCLIVLTSIKISKLGEATIIDETTGIAAVMLMISCILSFLAMKTNNEISANKLESVADIVFLTALICITITIALVSFNLFT
jgi:cytochrome bd-type quinol oxidase subunit 2